MAVPDFLACFFLFLLIPFVFSFGFLTNYGVLSMLTFSSSEASSILNLNPRTGLD